MSKHLAQPKLNRAQRRAIERRRVKQPMIRLGDLTLHEAELMAEWADAYLLQLADTFTDEELEPEQRWARARTKQLREMLQATVEDRPIFDEHAEREAPPRG